MTDLPYLRSGDSALRRTLPLVGVGVAVLVASIVELVRLVQVQPHSLAFIALALAVGGAALSLRLPWTGLVIAALSPLVAGVSSWEPIVEWSIAVFVLFAFTMRHSRPVRAALVVAVPTVTGVLVADGPASAVGAFLSVVAGAAIGAGIRTQARYRAALEQRAIDLVASRDAEANRRVAEERLRIARDLHDVVGHEIAVVNMQLGVIEISLGKTAPEVHDAVVSARVGVKNVLSETQKILAILRRNDAEGTPSGPTPGADQIPALIESFQGIGLDVSQRIDLSIDDVSPAAGLTLYRVLQEALTNAHRHGRGSVTITITQGGGMLTATVRNPRALYDQPTAGSGFGLVGLRERVDAAGGTLQIEDTKLAFSVTVQIPHERSPR